jgi:hypothetical protein
VGVNLSTILPSLRDFSVDEALFTVLNSSILRDLSVDEALFTVLNSSILRDLSVDKALFNVLNSSILPCIILSVLYGECFYYNSEESKHPLRKKQKRSSDVLPSCCGDRNI